jgi:hypothetical protein
MRCYDGEELAVVTEKKTLMLAQVSRCSLCRPMLLATAATLVLFLCWMSRSAWAGAPEQAAGPRNVGLGNVLVSQDGTQIFGFDIDQNGDDGLLATASTVETFDEDSGKITAVVSVPKGQGNTYGADAIFAKDAGLVTHFVQPKGSIYAIRYYDLINPVTTQKITGSWTPPIKDESVLEIAENQTTTTDLLFAIQLKNNDVPDLIVSNVAGNTFSNVIHLNPNVFGLAYGPQLGQYAAKHEAVFALSPDGGAVGGQAPVNVLFDLKTGKSTQFSGYNNGYYHAGFVNGLAVDPNTGIAATDTELNAQVEFYDLSKKIGIGFVQLPCTNDVSQTQSGSGIAVDPVNKLFLVTETYYCTGSTGNSAIIVYDENGQQKEVIAGFKFPIGEGAPALNPSKRIGWAFGGPKGFSELQQFFY